MSSLIFNRPTKKCGDYEEDGTKLNKRHDEVLFISYDDAINVIDGTNAVKTRHILVNFPSNHQ